MTGRVHASRDGAKRTCLECGAGLSETATPAAEFCADACRHAWNNRRKRRGAELYDLFMAHRFDRAEAGRLRVLTAMNRMAAAWRHQDRRERAGRRSWTLPATVLARLPWLRAAVLQRSEVA